MEIEKVMLRYVESIGHRRLKSAAKFIKESKDGLKKRKRLEALTGGYMSLDIDPKFLVPKAKEGSYQLILSDGKRKETASLTIRKDPMLDE